MINKKLNKNESLIKVIYCGLCGSDLHRIKNGANYRDLGHEVVGEIDVTFSKSFSVGDKVCVSPIFPCSSCYSCDNGFTNMCLNEKSIGKNINGGFSMNIVVNNKNLYKLNKKELNFEKYILVDTLASVIHSISFVKKEVKDKKICIIGDGAVGELTARYTTFLKAKEVVVIGKNLLTLTKYPSFRYDDKESLSSYSDYFDVVIDCVGGSSDFVFSNASNILRKSGSLVVLSVYEIGKKIDFIPRDYFGKEIKIYGSRSYTTNKNVDEFKDALMLLKNGDISAEEIITHKLSIDFFEDGLSFFTNKKVSQCRKVIFHK